MNSFLMGKISPNPKQGRPLVGYGKIGTASAITSELHEMQVVQNQNRDKRRSWAEVPAEKMAFDICKVGSLLLDGKTKRQLLFYSF